MARTIIDIPDPQLGDVDRLCRLLNISRAEAVRRALRDFVQQNDSVTSDGFGLWKEGLPDVAVWRDRLQEGRGRRGS